MKRIFSTLQRRPSSTPNGSPSYPDDSPEGKVINGVNTFCESGRDPANQGNDFVHLPVIVESAESSPNAAKEAAYRIRKLLSDPASTPANVQYNAIQLIRILVDNPGHTFTRNLDAKFVATIKSLLRHGRDMGVQHFLRETLHAMETQRSWDEDLALLLQMWAKEKDKLKRSNSAPSWWPLHTPDLTQLQTFVPNFQSRTPAGALPPPDELAARIAESKTSAKLLIQVVQSTPVPEMSDNELMKEFYERCRAATRSIQAFIHATNPPPDEDLLTTLIETNDELSVAQSKYHNAILRARKANGRNNEGSPAPSSTTPSASGAAGPPAPPPRATNQSPRQLVAELDTTPAPAPMAAPLAAPMPAASGGVQSPASNGSSGYEYRSEDFQVQNPFADNFTTDTAAAQHTGSGWKNTQQTGPLI